MESIKGVNENNKETKPCGILINIVNEPDNSETKYIYPPDDILTSKDYLKWSNFEISEKQKKNVPTNPSLWQSCLSWAKARYKVCPSAYCNGAAAKRYKSKGGKWKRK